MCTTISTIQNQDKVYFNHPPPQIPFCFHSTILLYSNMTYHISL